ncbi:MAG: hypothetical protein GEU74_07675 [Nitriliruptorales bacterium]|nr:hypothetical protein [Nitriliruptorales bacterium]
MMRHADPSDHSFRRSLLRAAGGGLAAMVVTFAITALLATVGRQDAGGVAAVTSPTAAAAAPTVTAVPSPKVAPTEAPTSTEPAPADSAPRPEPDDPSSVTIQVLDTVGFGSGPDALAAAEVLRGLGYDVVAVNPTRRTARTTTVLVTAGHRDEARALRDSDERFAEIRGNDGFSDKVDLHVLVGPGFAD